MVELPETMWVQLQMAKRLRRLRKRCRSVVARSRASQAMAPVALSLRCSRAFVCDIRSDRSDRASIDWNHRAGDVGRRRGQEERGHSAELHGVAVSAQRNVLGLASAHLIGITALRIKLAHSLSRDPDRQNSVYPDSGRPPFVGEHLDNTGEGRKDAV